MQKKLALLIVAGTITLTLIIMMVVFMRQKDESNFHHSEIKPEPTEISFRQEEDEKMNNDREAFFEVMHAASPGTNWRKMDADTRYQMMLQRAAKNNFARIESDEWDTLANGNVIGQWNEIGSYNTSGRIWATDIDFSSDQVYAFSDGGNLWKGDLDGSNWAVINDNFKIGGTFLLRKIGDRLIVGTYNWGIQGIYWTEDEGISWHETTGLENVETWGNVFDAEILNDASHTMYILAYEWDYVNWWDIISIYRSTDLGESFEKITSYDVPVYGNTNKFVLWASETGDPTCYLIENANCYQLNTITGLPELKGSLPYTDDGDIMLTGIDHDGTKELYAALNNYVTGTTFIYKSIDAGENWDETGEVESYNFSKNSFACSTIHPGYLYYGGVNSFRSFNAGADWTLNNEWYEYYDNTEFALHADIPFIKSFYDDASGNEIILTSTDGGLYKTSNSGLTWENITLSGMRNAQYYDVYTYRYVTNIMFAGAQDQGYQRSEYWVDGDYDFNQLISGDYGHIVSRSGGDDLWCIYPGFAMYITDAASGSNMFFWDFIGTGHLWMAPIMQDPNDDEVAWWGGGSETGGAYLWRLEKKPGGTIDAVQQAKNFSVAGGGSISAIAYSPIDANYWYLLTSNGNFYHSDDAGATWTMTSGFNGPDSHYFYGSSIEPSKTNLGEVYIAGSGYSNPPVYVTYDHGETFSAMNTGLPSTLVYDIAVSEDDSLLFAATEIAPYVYVKAEDKWYEIADDDAPLQVYWSVDYVEEIKTTRFGTYGRGAWEFKLYQNPVGIEGQNENLMCTVYPNPANKIVNITINAFMPDASVEVFNLNGETVLNKKAAINKNIPYHLKINDLPAGNYFIKIGDGKKEFVQKMIVAR